MSIEWKEGAVCYVDGRQWRYEVNPSISIESLVSRGGFQLNEMREGDYIDESELDTEQKRNDAVAVFGLFGFEFSGNAVTRYALFPGGALACFDGGLWRVGPAFMGGDRKLTYPQMMAIGKLKRAMIEREKVMLEVSGFNAVEKSIEKRVKRKKPRQAYDILESLDYEYDLVKQKWYKKQFV